MNDQFDNLEDERGTLILAAEECPDELFEKLHRFSNYEERIIRSLIAHGPVLIRGGRGSGKSTLLKKAHRRLLASKADILSIYLSMRYLPLIRSKGTDYENIFCKLLIDKINKDFKKYDVQMKDFSPSPNVGSVQQSLIRLSSQTGKRIVLFFDDAAHIGRETSLSEFFDIFRTLSSSSISCKAAIYPGVTKFGTRFDVFNDATVIDISRDEKSKYFTPFFLDVIEARYKNLLDSNQISRRINKEDTAKFLGRSVIGNMRAFVFLCNKIQFEEKRIGLTELTNSLLYLSGDYYWPLLEELAPKLGNYEPLIETSRQIAEKIFDVAKKTETTSVIVHREFVQKFLKPFEILEYAGFLTRREVSRAMKSGGRGSRFSLNLCNLLEIAEGKRLTQERFYKWLNDNSVPAEIHISSNVLNMELPEMSTDEMENLPILSLPVDKLAKSKAYPYGLTPNKIDVLKNNKILTIEGLAESSDQTLLSMQGIGDKFLKRIRDVVGQAIWM